MPCSANTLDQVAAAAAAQNLLLEEKGAEAGVAMAVADMKVVAVAESKEGVAVAAEGAETQTLE